MKETGSRTDPVDDIPAKRYFTIGEVAELCGLKAHVLRYWEQEFPQLSPVKRRGNRRYYQREDVLVIREIRHLLYKEGFTINGARQKLEQRDREARHKRPDYNPPGLLQTAPHAVPPPPAADHSPAMASPPETPDQTDPDQSEPLPADFQMAQFQKQKAKPLDPSTAREWRKMLEESLTLLNS